MQSNFVATSAIRGSTTITTLVRSIVAAAVVLGLTAPAADAAPPGKPANKSACVNIRAHGAQSNGADATRSIQNALNAARYVPAKCVYVPAGRYSMTRFTVPGGIKMIGDGDASVLFGPNAGNRQLKLEGSGTGLYDLKIQTNGWRRTNDNEAVWIHYGANNWVVDNVTIDGGNGPGIITYSGNYGRITNNRVSNTRSDSIHMSGGAHHVYIAGNKVRNSGDDMIAVVTYQNHNRNSYQILIENNDVAYQPWGRGITVVGGEQVTIRNNKIVGTYAAGIYIAAESSWTTRGVKDVVISNNRIDLAPWKVTSHGQPSYLAYSDNSYWIENVLFQYNTITNGKNGPARIGDRNMRNIACRGNTYNGASFSIARCNGNAATIVGTSVTSALLGGTTVAMPAP